MTGTDLYVNKPHCAALCDLERVEPQPLPSLMLGLKPVQSFLGVARVTSEQKVPRRVEQRIVIKFLVGENVPSAEIHHGLQQQYGEECLSRTSFIIWSFIHIHSTSISLLIAIKPKSKKFLRRDVKCYNGVHKKITLKLG
jgi:hypothetical protein